MSRGYFGWNSMLDADEVEAIAQRVVELLQPTEPDLGWVRMEVVCRRFGVSPTWVYAHARHPTRIRSEGQAPLRSRPLSSSNRRDGAADSFG